MSLNKELAKKWVDALRSGKYTQGRNALEHRGTYCCLGVLCEVSGIEIQKGESGSNKEAYAAIRELGVDQMRYVKANDEFCRSFHEIASMVEAEAGL